MVRNLKDPKTFIPKLSSSERFTIMKTEKTVRGESKRLFNSSKLSNISSETTPQHKKLSNDYKLMKVNFTQPGSVGFKKVPRI